MHNSTPTSRLTFSDLILEVSIKGGIASYGAGGDSAPAVPTDAHDLAEAKRVVNKAIRMFLSDSPPTGWRWTRPVVDIVLWPSLADDPDRTVSGGAYSAGDDETVLTASEDVFERTMETKPIVIDGVGTFTMKRYVSATSMVVSGDASAASSDEFAIVTDGNYVMPRGFSGSFRGAITYAPSTNQAVPLEWASEHTIRQLRENRTVETGWPNIAAIRIQENRHRWDLMVYPVPHELMVVQMAFDLHFDALDDINALLPIPFSMDEGLLAACRAMWEREFDDAPGNDWGYYREIALPNAHKMDAQSAPKSLGYFGDLSFPRVTVRNFREWQQRPNVRVV
jgi:hypothetical protein